MLSLALSGRAVASQAQIDTAWNKGVAWLLTHQRADGSWRSVAGTEFAATAAALEALNRVNVKGHPFALAVAWLSNADATSVDSLARRILALKAAGLNVTPALQTLVGWRNSSLTWGAYDRFETSFPDTPLAVAALRTAQFSYTDLEYVTALCAILAAQKTEGATVQGSWSHIDPWIEPPPPAITSAILPTARNLLEINALGMAKGWSGADCDGTLYTIATATTNGIDWLVNHRRHATNGGFGEPLSGSVVSTVFDTALAYEVLATLRPVDPATGPSLDYLIAHQQPDGSWNGDALQTAFVLKVLPAPTGVTLADSDKDSIPNTVEPILGTNPNLADSRWLASPFDGDLNQDGVVDAADVGLAEQLAGGQLQPTPLLLRHGDVAPP
ncbi:MAG TPA: prenyltransferase/squalene oxidase repeat-containing protein, partial [Candidatus Methylomirabilis sp.]|nr:prenyltransferase/squalene oxidase repeat-containing protein [Candidatus Methylomirabilis sp.]